MFDADRPDSQPRPLRLGSVSFLNARPLIYGLESAKGIELSLDVPSRLLDGLLQERFDVALLPVIDYQRMPGLRLLAAGGIGCDGPTLTVRIFSPVPVERIETLACDADSHTSVALARIILAERFAVRPEFIELNRSRFDSKGGGTTAVLLIGDKVVCEEPRGLHYQIDLGEAWKQLTGLPFVFAAWMARAGIELSGLNEQLANAKRAGLEHVDQIIRQFAQPRGWPAETARKYLTQNLQYDIGPRQLEAIRLFHDLAHRHAIIEHAPFALQISEPV